MEAKGMQWHALVWELDLPVDTRTLRCTLHKALDYGKYDAGIKEALSERIKHDRYMWADNALAIRPTIEHWKIVQFSDEMHAGFGPEGQLKIICKRGTAMRGRSDNIQHQHKPTDNQAIGKVHVWAAIGWSFESPLIYYEVKDPQGAITHKAYIEQILEWRLLNGYNEATLSCLNKTVLQDMAEVQKHAKTILSSYSYAITMLTRISIAAIHLILLATIKELSTKKTSLGQANTAQVIRGGVDTRYARLY